MKPFSYDIHRHLEKLYSTHCQLIKANPNDETLTQTKYYMNEYPV